VPKFIMDARVKPGHDAECLARVSHRIQTCVVARVLYGPGQAVSILLPRRPEKEPRARGTPGSWRTRGPRHLAASRRAEVRITASPPFPRRPARGVLRFAPPRPRWTSRFRRPASPLELEGRLSTAVGPGRIRRACDRCRSRHHGARRRAVGAPGRGGLDRRLGDRRRISSAPNRPPPPAPRQKTLDQTPLGSEGGM